MNSLSKIFISLVLLSLSGLVSISQAEENNTNLVELKQFLVAGPLPVKPPVIINSSAEKFDVKDILEYKYKDIKNWWPQDGDNFQWDSNTSVEWDEFEHTDKDGILLDTERDGFSLYYLAFYINTKTFFKGKLKLSSHHLFEVYADGNKICSKTKSDSEKPEKEEFTSGRLSLEPGNHLIIIKALYDIKSTLPRGIKIKLESENEFDKEMIFTSVNPERRMTLEHLLDIPEIKGVSISSDGKYAAINYRQIKDDGKGYNYWIDVLNTETGKALFPKRVGQNISSLKWVPKSSKFSFITTEGKKKAINLVDLKSGETKTILENIENLSDYNWSPDASFVIYAIPEKPKEDTEGLKKLQGMADRWPSWRDKDELFLLDVKTGTSRQLTKSKNSSYLYDIHPDSDKILVVQSEADYMNRPYSKTHLYTLDFNSMRVDSIWSGHWFKGASFSPDGTKLLVNGAPAIFDGIGNTLPKDIIPSGSEAESYIYDLESRKVKPITKNFDPSVTTSYWYKNNIYFTVTDKSQKQLYKYNTNSSKYSKINIGMEVIDKIAYADNSPFAVYYGSSATQPQGAYFIDLKNDKFRLLSIPSKEIFKHTKLSSVKRWTFKNKNNVEIEGRVYYPPNFDANKRYPCIVYYYGGVSPVVRNFGGRYPKNFYSAHDYIVYVLQPSGCVGFGQEFAALHVNDWGKIVADEIIDGTGKFLEAHPFVDKEKVGCIGASYGGFMTMLLMTKTDIFATGISHAGISDITSYWGEGFYGYWYNSIAAANSFPWNRKDIYIDQSPLFGANNIKSPLLLLHGDADTNVPPGESRQLYTALKLLGKEVELIEVAGQNHWILEHNKRKKWTKTIVAWFDKWLKVDDSWWKELYSE
jgi:dipeptidyl aminopeptidase/acylaminoacyl peptidase